MADRLSAKVYKHVELLLIDADLDVQIKPITTEQYGKGKKNIYVPSFLKPCRNIPCSAPSIKSSASL